MEIFLILLLLILLIGILFLAYKLIKWILGSKFKSRVFGSLLVIALISAGINHLFCKNMQFVQSEVYPNLYLVKYPEADEQHLHQAIRETVENHLSLGKPVNSQLAYQKDNAIFFYVYTKVFPLSVFQDAGTAYFLENEEDLGGFVTEELGMYGNFKLAEFNYAPCKTSSPLSCGELQFFHDAEVVKTESLNNVKPLSSAATSPESDTDIDQLKLAYSNKNAVLFLKTFPATFQQFVNVFGWDEQADRPNPLYEESYSYIDYFFALIAEKNYQDYEDKVVQVSIGGKWQADAVNYFQDKALAYIKDTKRYHLINELEYADAKSVLFFLFDGPHPRFDKAFTHSLNNDKLHIVYDLFANEFAGWDKHLSLINEDFSYYVDNENYFIRDIDVNNDYAMDKVVSAVPYQTDELLVFIHSDGEYRFAFKTTNFSQDGGQQIVDVVAEENGFYIHTRFPFRGINEAYHHIAFTERKLIFTHSVVKFQKSIEEDAPIYTCDIPQGIDFSDPNLLNKVAPLPNEGENQSVC